MGRHSAPVAPKRVPRVKSRTVLISGAGAITATVSLVIGFGTYATSAHVATRAAEMQIVPTTPSLAPPLATEDYTPATGPTDKNGNPLEEAASAAAAAAGSADRSASPTTTVAPTTTPPTTTPRVVPPPAASCPNVGFTGVQPHVARVAWHVAKKFNLSASAILGVGGRAGDSDHPTGLAIDFLVNRATGDAINAYVLQNQAALDVKYTIWRQTFYARAGAGTPMEDRGSATANHYDHVHVSFAANGDASPTC